MKIIRCINPSDRSVALTFNQYMKYVYGMDISWHNPHAFLYFNYDDTTNEIYFKHEDNPVVTYFKLERNCVLSLDSNRTRQHINEINDDVLMQAIKDETLFYLGKVDKDPVTLVIKEVAPYIDIGTVCKEAIASKVGNAEVFTTKYFTIDKSGVLLLKEYNDSDLLSSITIRDGYLSMSTKRFYSSFAWHRIEHYYNSNILMRLQLGLTKHNEVITYFGVEKENYQDILYLLLALYSNRLDSEVSFTVGGKNVTILPNKK